MQDDRPAAGLEARINQLDGMRRALTRRRRKLQQRATDISNYLIAAPAIDARLESLSDELFGQLVAALEENLTAALLEVLEQPLRFRVDRSIKRGTLSLEFFVQRDEEREDILHGQGGSVANILSVGLRFFALATLDESTHRRFLVLDEQDCWLRPDLVPRLVRIIYDAGRSLGFQVLLISHHELAAFTSFADRVYELTPAPDGVLVRRWQPDPSEMDEQESLT